jgi:hypothetical protein
MRRGLERSSVVGKNFREAGKNFVVGKLVGVPEMRFWRFGEQEEGSDRDFEAIAELEMFEVVRGQASGMMKLRLAYSRYVEKLPAEA